MNFEVNPGKGKDDQCWSFPLLLDEQAVSGQFIMLSSGNFDMCHVFRVFLLS